MKIVIFGYGLEGVNAYRKFADSGEYEVIGFADNSVYKQGKIVNGLPIMSMYDLIQLKNVANFAVIIASCKWFVIGEELRKVGISIHGVYQSGKITQYNRMNFERLDLSKEIVLYAGDICDEVHMANPNLYGLSISKADSRHIFHDITNQYPLPDNSIFSYQAEDVLEHIEFSKLLDTINEIYRILKKDGLFRICLPDYFSPYLSDVSMKDVDGNILFDPTGGGSYGENGVSNGGHIWFPDYLNVQSLLSKTKFKSVSFLCYHTEQGDLVKKDIDFSKGYIKRIPKEGEKDKPIYSIIVDCYK